MSEIASIVSTIGFPIASFLLSAYFIKYSYDKQLERDREKDEQESNCYKRNLNDDDVFGQGTQNAVNSILSAHGYIENGIAGNGFAELISKELERK